MKLNLLDFLLHENKIMYEKIENEFDQVLRTEYPVNYIGIKANVIKHNATLKVNVNEEKRNDEDLKRRNVLDNHE